MNHRFDPITRLLQITLTFCALSLVGCQAQTSPGGSPGGKASGPRAQPSAETQDGTITIDEARQLEGRKVRISGTVTVQSGAYAASISSGFAVQDDTAGIYVIDNAHSYQLGQKVRVIGTVGAENSQLSIKREKSTLLSGSGTIRPRQIETGNLGAAESGYLVAAEGKITKLVDDGKYGYKLFIDDGSGPCQVFINASTELIEQVASWQPGDVIRVVGFAGRYNDIYEIMPRILPDIQRKSGRSRTGRH